MTDAGLTPYRAIKKIRHLLIATGTNIAIVRSRRTGSYAVRSAKIFGAGSNVIAIDVDDRRLELAESWSDHMINTKMQQDIRKEVLQKTGGNGLNVVVDCVGTEETIRNSVRTLSKGGSISNSWSIRRADKYAFGFSCIK